MTTALSTFFSAWSETDAEARTALIEGAMTGSATYSDPRSGGRLAGTGPISEYVGMFSANAPGWTAEVTASDEVNGYVRAIVKFGGMGPDGQPMAQHGTYVADMDGDKIAALAGFAGESPS